MSKLKRGIRARVESLVAAAESCFVSSRIASPSFTRPSDPNAGHPTSDAPIVPRLFTSSATSRECDEPGWRVISVGPPRSLTNLNSRGT